VGRLVPGMARSVSIGLGSRSNTLQSDEVLLTGPWNDKGVGMGMGGIKGSTIVSDMNDRESSTDNDGADGLEVWRGEEVHKREEGECVDRGRDPKRFSMRNSRILEPSPSS